MKRGIAAIALAMLCLVNCGGSAGTGESGKALPAPPGQPAEQTLTGRIEYRQLASAALGRTMNIEVYLPPGYSAARRYPVLYLLYGYGGNEDSYFGGLLSVNRVADRLIGAGTIAPLLIVVPNYANSFGVNTRPEDAADSAGGTIGLYEDYLIGEVLPYVEQHYSAAASRAQRYVGGISMGGYAALYLGLSHPDLFGRIGAHSAALWDYGATNADQFVGQRDWLYATPALRALRDPMLLAQHANLDGLRFYLDAGDGDALRLKDQQLAGILRARATTVDWHHGDGGHDVPYWRGQLENYLQFYGAAE